MAISPDFESIKQVNVLGREYWSARGLMVALGYDYWQNFEKVIEKALSACKLTQQNVSIHFIESTILASIGSGGKRAIVDYHFTRYALHLVLSFADFKKPQIMQAIAYFTLTSLAHNNYLDIAQDLNISISSNIAITKEQKTIGEIMRTFKHLKLIPQYKVAPYRIDLYFPDERIAVECDEWGHRDYPLEKEHFRQSYIKQKLLCTFVRYNPDCKGFHIGDVIHEIIMLIYSNERALV
jgi:very-short-patch-repair endonuclease